MTFIMPLTTSKCFAEHGSSRAVRVRKKSLNKNSNKEQISDSDIIEVDSSSEISSDNPACGKKRRKLSRRSYHIDSDSEPAGRDKEKSSDFSSSDYSSDFLYSEEYSDHESLVSQ